MSTLRQILADRIKNAVAKKCEAAEALVTARDAGEGPLFSEAQIRILAAVCKQTGTDPAEFVATCTAKIRPTLLSKATGEELLVFVEKAVGKIQEQNRPKPSFSQENSETMPKLSSGHWYADQSPSGRWADEVEEEEKSRRSGTTSRKDNPAGTRTWTRRRTSLSSEAPTGTPSCKSWTFSGQAGQPDGSACETCSPGLACLYG